MTAAADDFAAGFSHAPGTSGIRNQERRPLTRWYAYLAVYAPRYVPREPSWQKGEFDLKSLIHDPFNIIVSGVGGQGNILASDIISRAFCEDEYFVSVGETYGATQRGGSVVSHIRISCRHLYGPLIPAGDGHVIIGFEPLEIYRILIEYGHDDLRVVMNDRPLYPLDSLQKRSPYPVIEELTERIESLSTVLKIVPASILAREAGHPMTLNVVMVGAFSGLNWLPLNIANFQAPLEKLFSGEKLAINRRAFNLGYSAGQEPGWRKEFPHHASRS
jgi:indolepyruvate ferredoxin oxidoreductase beta subunit